MALGRDAQEERRLVIATIAIPSKTSETNAILLTESIRAFGGAMAQIPIWCFTPDNESSVSITFKKRLESLEAALIPVELERETLEFAFAGHVQAAANAESKAMGQAQSLVWLAPNTLVLQEPRAYLLQSGKSLGYRPVHHKLLGSDYGEPLDEFWTLIYDHCGVREDRVFPMRTQVEDIAIRPYFNAGSLVVDPGTKIMRTWLDTFFRIFQKPEYQRFYNQDSRYEIFMHQAVLSGVILSNLVVEQMEELPLRYNYPLNLYSEDETPNRPESLEECVTIRHEGFYEDSRWMEKIPARSPLKEWIAERLL
ncbi:MAG: hypothetical protein ACXADS_11840 [Candidatus Thorarchaeota archaeon]